MGAVSGFAGPPDERLAETMAAALAHRGSALVQTSTAAGGSITIRGRRAVDGASEAASTLLDVPEHDLTFALCGLLTGFDDDRPRQQPACNGWPQRPFDRGADAAPLAGSLHRIAELYLREQLAVAGRLRGAWLLIIRDGRRIHLVRDGAGNRSLYYGRFGSHWLFASEPKAITQVPGFLRNIRPAAIAQYLACSFVPGEGTMLENLWKVPAGACVTLEPDRDPQLTRWFRFEDLEPEQPAREQADDEQFVREFREGMQRAVLERMPRGDSVGVFLSGGLDSSLVTAELAKLIGGRNVRSWSIHFGPKYPHELEFARQVADRCGTDHEEVLIQPRDFLPRLRQMVWYLDEPIGDPITQPNFELARHVSRDVSFVFNGEGGDPCFGGPKNIPMMLHHWYGGLPREPNFRERRYLESYRRGWEELELLLSEDVRRQLDLERDLDGLFSPYLNGQRPRRFLNRLTAVNIREKGAHLILPKIERMLGAFGVTPLSPLFDERLIELSFRIPPRLKLARGVEKVILKRAYQHDLPGEVIARPKSGMRVPVHYWFQSEMRRYARRILSPRAVRQAGLFNPERVKQLLAYEVEEGRGRYGLRLWMLITFEIWRRMVVEGESC